MAKNVQDSFSSSNHDCGMEYATKSNNTDYEVNISSDFSGNALSEESPNTKFGEWLNEFNEMKVSPQSNESNAKSSRSQIEISKSGVFVVDDYCEQYTPESNSPVHFTPRDCWLEEHDQHTFSSTACLSPPAFGISSPAFVFNSSTYTQVGYNTSTPHNQFWNIQPSPMQNVPRAKCVPNISPEIAREKCSHLRRIRLQTPSKKDIEIQNKISQRCAPRRSSLNDIRNHRLSLKHHNSSRRTQRERLSWPCTGSECRNSSKENISENSSLYYNRTESSWEYPMEDTDEVEPVLKSYQLLGDSLLVRFAEQVLYNEVKMVQGTRTIGLCVSGQKIMDLYQKVSMKKYPVSEKIVLLIGTNDILQNTDDEDMQQTLEKLLNELLRNYVSRIVLLTIPPIPKLQGREDQWQRIEMYNTFIKSLKGEHIIIADINELYLEHSRSCRLEYFEKFYGDGVRKDLIHLNKFGLKEIYNFLTENNFLT